VTIFVCVVIGTFIVYYISSLFDCCLISIYFTVLTTCVLVSDETFVADSTYWNRNTHL